MPEEEIQDMGQNRKNPRGIGARDFGTSALMKLDRVKSLTSHCGDGK